VRGVGARGQRLSVSGRAEEGGDNSFITFMEEAAGRPGERNTKKKKSELITGIRWTRPRALTENKKVS